MAGIEKFECQREKERFALFALVPFRKIEDGWINLHLLLWKHLVATMVAVELEGAKYDERSVWAPAWKRFEKKALALEERVRIEIRRAEARGEEPPDMEPRSHPLRPIGRFSKEGKLEWNQDLVAKIKDLAGLKSGEGSAAPEGAP